LSLSSTRNHQN